MNERMVAITARLPHPGEFLREDYLPEFSSSVAGLAGRLGRLFGTTAQYWLNLQRDVDLWDSLELNCESIENVEPLPLAVAG